MSRRLDGEEIARQLVDLPGWGGDESGLARSYAFPEFLVLVRSVSDIAVVAEAMNHHPDLDIRWRTLRVALSTHDAGGVTQLDIELAHRIHEIVTGAGAH